MSKGNISIWYSDGHQGLYYDEKGIERDEDGNELIQILVVPDRYLKEQYHLTDDKLPIVTDEGRHGRWMTYKTTDLFWLKPNRRLLILSDFWGSPNTSLIKKIDIHMKLGYEREHRLVNALRVYAIGLHRKLNIHMNQDLELLRNEQLKKSLMEGKTPVEDRTDQEGGDL